MAGPAGSVTVKVAPPPTSSNPPPSEVPGGLQTKGSGNSGTIPPGTLAKSDGRQKDQPPTPINGAGAKPTTPPQPTPTNANEDADLDLANTGQTTNTETAKGDASSAKPAPTSKTDSPATPQTENTGQSSSKKFDAVRVSLGGSAALLGGPDAGLLPSATPRSSENPQTGFGDFGAARAKLMFLWNVFTAFDDKLKGQLGIGAAGSAYLGGVNVSDAVTGAPATLGTLQATVPFKLDWRAAYPEIFGGPSAITFGLDGGYLWGKHPLPGIDSRLQHQEGGLLSLWAGVTALSFGLSDTVNLGLEVEGRTSFAKGGKGFNTPLDEVGVNIVLDVDTRKKPEPPKAPPPPPVPVVEKVEVEKCDDLQAQIKANLEDAQRLLGEVSGLEEKARKQKHYVETRDLDRLETPEKVLAVLREQAAARIYQQLAAENPPKDDNAKAALQKQAEEDAKIPGKGGYADGYNHWEVREAKIDASRFDVPDPLPTDCDELKVIAKKVSDAKEDLYAYVGELRRIADTTFAPRKVFVEKQIVERVRPSLKAVHFKVARPTSTQLVILKKAISQARSAGKDPLEVPGIKSVFLDVFGGAKGYEDAGKAADSIVQLLKDFPNLGKEKKIGVAGHTSAEPNQSVNVPLSQRRAELILILIDAKGGDISRLEAKGYGYTPATAKTPEEGLKGPELANAKDANRRMELEIPDSELDQMIKATETASAGGSTSGTASTESVPTTFTPPPPIQTSFPSRLPPPPAKPSGQAKTAPAGSPKPSAPPKPAPKPAAAAQDKNDL